MTCTMEMFCNDVYNGEKSLFSYYYDPDVANKVTARCVKQKDVIEL